MTQKLMKLKKESLVVNMIRLKQANLASKKDITDLAKKKTDLDKMIN